MSSVQRLRHPAAGGASLIELPEYIITTFIPSLNPLLQQYPNLFRFLGVLLALWYFGPFARLKSLWSQCSALLVSTITVSSEEDLFGYLTSWFSEVKTLRYDHSLTAASNVREESRRSRRHEVDLDESRRREDPKIKYEHAQGIQFFVHQGRLFYASRKDGDGHTYVGTRWKKTEILTLSCLGRSTKPIQDLMEQVYSLNKEKERSQTIIRRPYPGSHGGKLTWSRLTSKPKRALNTVILDGKQKETILADVAEYIAEPTMAFYASHGIPYRRGYLFYGPPGVGKTSFALAIASKFNLEVYNLSLLDENMTDSDLVNLLNQMPARSLLLMEDIDSAGLNRKTKAPTPSRGRMYKASSNEKANEGDNDEDDEEGNNKRRSRVTLSGLLNAIDGVAAPEGHILIMTTNKPQALDEALVRAGRVSVRVEFQKASKAVAEGVFERMFIETKPDDEPDVPEEKAADVATAEPAEPIFDDAEVGVLAKQFATKIPDLDFSPADLQDYLLVHKKNPRRAVDELEGWMKEQHEERRRQEEERTAELEAKKEKLKEEQRSFREEVREALKEVKEADTKQQVTLDVKTESGDKPAGEKLLSAGTDGVSATSGSPVDGRTQ